jgi:hypothetical protein
VHHFKQPEYQMTIMFDRKTRVYWVTKRSPYDNRDRYMSKSVFKEWYANWTESVRADFSASMELMDDALSKCSQSPD